MLVGYSTLDREQLERLLAFPKYELTIAESEAEAVRVLARERVTALLVDVASPGLDGLRTLRHLSSLLRPTAVVVLSAVNDAAVAASCFRQGAADYVVQPVQPAVLEATLEACVQRRRDLIRQGLTHEVLRDELASLTMKLHRARRRSAQVSMSALGSLVSMMEIRDPFLAGHSTRVAQLAASLAAELGATTRIVEQVRAAGRLHDIGMLCVAQGILSKTGPLTLSEFERVKQHVIIADQILQKLPQLDAVRSFVRSHHERWDGSGYPDGLVGDTIPWGARIIGAAEVYDAFTTSRPYRTARTPQDAIEEMAALSGTAIAPEAYQALVNIVQNGRALIFIDGEDHGEPHQIETPNASTTQ